MIPILGIPYLNRPDLLERCIRSIDYPVNTLVIVDNSYGTLHSAEELGLKCGLMPRRMVVITQPNAGVAASWNQIVTLFPAKYWVISNSDIQFGYGDLEKMANFTEKEASTTAIVYGNHGASWFAVTEYGIRNVGLWDINLHPAYLEDCCWSYRAKLVGACEANVPGVKAVHGDGKLTGSCTINSDPKFQRNNCRTHARNFVYYENKWGGKNGEEKFKNPFNDPNWPVWAWKFDPAMRKEQQW